MYLHCTANLENFFSQNLYYLLDANHPFGECPPLVTPSFLPSFPPLPWFTMLCPFMLHSGVIQLHTYEHSLSYSFPYGLLQSTEYSLLLSRSTLFIHHIRDMWIYITIYHNLPLLIYFAGMLLTALDTSCGWNHPVFVFLWLALFAQHSVLEGSSMLQHVAGSPFQRLHGIP